jgi:pimeloyl-ACP methyl ester carboxylesterase
MRLHQLLLAIVIGMAMTVSAAPLTAQDAPEPIVEARFATVGGLRLEYFAFGDSGIPAVWVQDHHDYFREATFGLEQAEEWVAFLERFADAFQVLAPVRRGWGASDDPGYGFDVATQAEDLLGLLDALGIDRAVFVGRTIATQELTWIAEHHPNRVIGLVYLGTPHVMGTGQFATPTPAVERWAEMYNRVACDIGVGSEVDRRLQPRNSFRAHFVEDSDVRINIPTLLSLHPLIDREGHNLRRLDWLEAGELGGDDACDPEARTYFDELARSPARMAELRRAFQEEADALLSVRERMERAFGDRLTVVWEPGEFGLEPWYSAIRPFLERLGRQ